MDKKEVRDRDQIACSCFESRLEMKQDRVGKAGDGWIKEIKYRLNQLNKKYKEEIKVKRKG